MLKEVLIGVLTKEQREAGLWLDELDDHTLELKQYQVNSNFFYNCYYPRNSKRSTKMGQSIDALEWVNSF